MDAHLTNQVHTFAGNPLDRGESIRRDESAIEALAQNPNSQFLAFHQLKVLVADSQALVWQPRAQLPEHGQTVFLGIHEEVARFAVNIPAPDDADAYADCRAVAAQLPTHETGILAQARAQLDWHRRNKFCAECGQPSFPERGGQIRRCSGCG